jgi:hypothetical protein
LAAPFHGCPRWQSPDEGVSRAEKLSHRALAVLWLIIDLEGWLVATT